MQDAAVSGRVELTVEPSVENRGDRGRMSAPVQAAVSSQLQAPRQACHMPRAPNAGRVERACTERGARLI